MIVGFFIGLLVWFIGVVFGGFISEELVKSVSSTVFQLEKYIQEPFKMTFFSDITRLFYSLAISILIFKFVKKGFNTYVLWRDGDPDESPSLLFTNFVFALVVLFSFSPFFDLVVNIFEDVTNTVFHLIDSSKATIIPNVDFIDSEMIAKMEDLKTADKSTIDNILGIFSGMILAVSAVLLYFKLIVKGIEIYILKLGFPLATIGLIDNDGGMFKEYVNVLIQALTTISLQIVLFKIGIVISSVHSIIGACFIIFALRTPEVLSKFLITSRGGVASSVYHSSKMVVEPFKAMKSLFNKAGR